MNCSTIGARLIALGRRLPCAVDGVMLQADLTHLGVRLRAKRSVPEGEGLRSCDKVLDWLYLDTCKVDPVPIYLEYLLQEMEVPADKIQEVLHAGG